MRRLLSLLILSVLIWSAYWGWGAQKNKTRMTEWILEQRAQLWLMDFESLDQMGYPNRFDITLSNPSIHTSQGAIAWNGTFLQILRLSYNPNHTIIVFPPSHNFKLGEKVFLISHEKARASVINGASQGHRTVLEITGLEVSFNGFKLGFSSAQLAILQEAEKHRAHITLSSLNSNHKTKIKNLTISGEIKPPTAQNRFPIPIINGLGAHFTNLKVSIDDKTIISDGTITVTPDLELDGHIFTSQDIMTGSGPQDSHVNHIQIEDIATPFGIRVSQMPRKE